MAGHVLNGLVDLLLNPALAMREKSSEEKYLEIYCYAHPGAKPTDERVRAAAMKEMKLFYPGEIDKQYDSLQQAKRVSGDMEVSPSVRPRRVGDSQPSALFERQQQRSAGSWGGVLNNVAKEHDADVRQRVAFGTPYDKGGNPLDARYRYYPDEPLNGRLQHPAVVSDRSGNRLVMTVDGKERVFPITGDQYDAYVKGSLPVNVLANAVLKHEDALSSNFEEMKDRQRSSDLQLQMLGR